MYAVASAVCFAPACEFPRGMMTKLTSWKGSGKTPCYCDEKAKITEYDFS